MISVLIADDHAFLRTGVEAVLRGSRFEIVATASNGIEALAAIEGNDPMIAIFDLRMPLMDGLAALQELRHRGDNRPVVLLTAELSDEQLLEAIKASVNGILMKDGAEDRLLTCLNAVYSGQRSIDPAMVERAMLLSINGPPPGPLDGLAPRELKIAALVARGMRNRAIADDLAMTEGTVKVYLHHIYEKLGVENRTELAMLARDQPISEPTIES